MVDFAPLRSLRVQQVQPFTYRDGITFLELLERLATHVKDVLEPSLKSIVDDLVEQFTTEMGEHRDAYVAGVEEFQSIHDAFMADVNAHLMALNDTAVSDLVEDETSLLGGILNQKFATKDELHITETDVVKTVGSGGDYATINEGLKELSRTNALYRSKGVKAELRLLSGFVMAEQVIVEQQDLGWITITSEDPVVTIQRSAITYLHTFTGRNAFSGKNGATLPMIATLFEFDTTGEDLGQHGCGLYFNSRVTFDHYAGIRNAPGRGINVQQGSHASIFRGIFSGAGDGGIRVANNSTADAEEAEATHCKNFGVSITSGAVAMVNRGTFTHNDWGVGAAAGSSISAVGADVSDNNFGFYIRKASTGDITDGIANDCNIALDAREAGVITAKNASLLRAQTNAISAIESSTVNADNSTADNSKNFIYCDASTVNVSNAQANNCQDMGVAVRNGGIINAENLVATNTGNRAVTASNGGRVTAVNADFSGAGGNGVRCAQGSTAIINGANTRTGLTDSPSDIVCQTGSTIVATGAIGGFGVTANQITSSGVIIQ